jgi:hypothetical protein
LLPKFSLDSATALIYGVGAPKIENGAGLYVHSA